MLIAGARSDQILAASITPSAKRSIVSRAALDNLLVNTTPAARDAVSFVAACSLVAAYGVDCSALQESPR